MHAKIRRRSTILLTAAYLLASQVTVVCIVSEWYSSTGESAVALQSGPMKEHAVLSWTPRTHLPLNQQGDLSPAVVPALASYLSEKAFLIIRCDRTLLPRSVSYFAPLSNKAPPTA